MNKSAAGQQYAKINAQTGIVDADPHRLIQMLYAGALEQISVARGCIQREDIAGKGEAIGKAIGIVGGLRDSLDAEPSSESAALSLELAALYEFVTTKLSDANVRSDIAALDESATVLRELQDGWNGIRADAVAHFKQSSTMA